MILTLGMRQEYSLDGTTHIHILSNTYRKFCYIKFTYYHVLWHPENPEETDIGTGTYKTPHRQ